MTSVPSYPWLPLPLLYAIFTLSYPCPSLHLTTSSFIPGYPCSLLSMPSATSVSCCLYLSLPLSALPLSKCSFSAMFVPYLSLYHPTPVLLSYATSYHYYPCLYLPLSYQFLSSVTPVHIISFLYHLSPILSLHTVLFQLPLSATPASHIPHPLTPSLSPAIP